MAKNNNKVEETTEKVESASTETSSVVEKPKKIDWPEVGQTGKFHAVEFGGGWVVYNPVGQRATGVLTKDQAADVAREQNRAAQIKIK